MRRTLKCVALCNPHQEELRGDVLGTGNRVKDRTEGTTINSVRPRCNPVRKIKLLAIMPMLRRTLQHNMHGHCGGSARSQPRRLPL